MCHKNYKWLCSSNAVNNDNTVCSFPEWMSNHRDWRAVGDELPGLLQASSSVGMTSAMHVFKRGHSLKFKYHTSSTFATSTTFEPNRNSQSSSLESHATCHKLEEKSKHMSKIVAHVKSGW